MQGVRGIQGPHPSPSTAGGVGPEAKEEESWTFSRFHHGYARAWSRGWLAALGGVHKTLAEVKVIGAVKSYYPKNRPLARRTRAVDRRGALVPGEYTRPLECLDRNYHNTAPGDTGPLVRRLLGYGRLQLLVMGSCQEGTKDLHSLLDLLADLIVRRLGLARGRELSDREKAQTLSDYRRILWVTAARASSGCLIGRLARFGSALRAAAKRREWVRREGEREDEGGEGGPLEGKSEGTRCYEGPVCRLDSFVQLPTGPDGGCHALIRCH